MGSNAIGEIPVVVTGDYSQLSTALAEAQNAAQRSGSAIASALSQGAASADQGVKSLEDRIQSLIDSGHTLAEALKLDADAMAQISSSASDATTAATRLSDSIEPVAGGAEHAAQSLGEFGTQAHDAGEAAAHAHEGSDELLHTLLEFAGIAVTAEALKEFVLEAVETYAAVQKATVALGALMGSAEAAKEAIEGLKELALQDALSFPALLQAQQRLTAFGVSAEAIPGALSAIADAAAATNHDFGDTANTFERIIASGNAMGRTLVGLGLTTADLAKVMQVAEADVKETFKALDQQQRIEVLEQALKKFEGTAAAVADTLAGQWQKLKNQAEFAFEGVGEAVAPAAAALMKLASIAIENLGPSIKAIGDLSRELVSLVGNFQSLASEALQVVHSVTGLPITLEQVTSALRNMNLILTTMAPYISGLTEALKLLNQVLQATGAQSHGVDETAKATEHLAKVDTKPVAEGVKELDAAFTAIHPKAASIADVVDQMAKGFDSLAKVLAHDFNVAWQDYAAGLPKIIADQEAANRAVKDAQLAMTQLTDAFRAHKPLADGHLVTLQDLARAQKLLDDAIKAANPGLADQKKAVDTVKTAWDDYLKEFDKLTDSRAKLNEFAAFYRDAVANFGAESDQAKAAIKLLNDEIKKLGDDSIQSINDLTPSLAKATNSVQVLSGHFQESDKTLQGLIEKLGRWPTIAEQIAAGMKVVTGHVTDAANAAGKLGDNLTAAAGATSNLTDLASHLVSPFDSVLNTLSEIYKMLGLIDQQTVTDTADAGAMANAESGALSGGGGGGGEGGGGRGGGGMGSFPLFDPAHPENGGWTITWSTESGTGYPIAKMTYHQPYNLPPLEPGQSNTDFRNIFGQHPPSTGGAATPPAPAPDILGAYGGTSIPADMLKAFVDGTISADQLTAAMQALATVTQTSTRATADTQQTLQSATSDTSFALTGLSNAVQSTQQAVPQIVETLQSSFGKLESVTADTVSQLQVYQDYLKSINDLNSQIQAENAARHAQALSDARAFPNAKIRLGLPDIPAAVPLPPSAFTPSGNINDLVIPAGRTTVMTVNINNPTIANQSVADRLVTQLRDMGMRT